MAKKSKDRTREQVEAAQSKAVRFLRDVVGDEEKAVEIESLSVSEYADRKGFLVTNPSSTAKPKTTKEARLKKMTATSTGNNDPRTKTELLQENEELHELLDDIWNANVDIADDSSKEDALDACLETCQILNEFDEDRFPFDSDGEADGEAEAA